MWNEPSRELRRNEKTVTPRMLGGKIQQRSQLALLGMMYQAVLASGADGGATAKSLVRHGASATPLLPPSIFGHLYIPVSCPSGRARR